MHKVGGSCLVDRRDSFTMHSSADIPSINVGKRSEPVADLTPGLIMGGRGMTDTPEYLTKLAS
jgi:hypothetical protein